MEKKEAPNFSPSPFSWANQQPEDPLLAADFPAESTSMAKNVHAAVHSPDLQVISGYEATYMVIMVYRRPSTSFTFFLC